MVSADWENVCRRSQSWCANVHAVPPDHTVPCRSSSLDVRCRARIRSPRTSSRARTRSRAASCATVGTTTGVISSRRSNRARCWASLASVLTRSPDGRCSFDGAATTHRMLWSVRNRASPEPVGPASYTTATGPGSSRSQPSTASGCGPSRARNISPVLASIPQATTDLACTSRPTLVRSRCTGTSRNCRHYRPGSPAPATHDNLRARSRPAGPGTSIPSNRHTCPYPQDIDGLSHDSQPLGRLATLGPAAAGGVPATLHQLSHFHATELVNGGVSLSTIRKRLGHRNLQTSLRYAEQTDAVAAAELRAWRRDHKQQRHNDTEPTAETAHLTAHCPWGQLWDRKVPGRLAQRRPLGPVRPQGLRQSRGVV